MKATEQIATDGQFTSIGGSAVSDDLSGLDLIAYIDDRLLVQAGVLVGALEFGEA